MEEGKKPIPFGLLFEEPASQPQSPIIPTYDEETDVSFVDDAEAECVKQSETTLVRI